MYCDAHEIEDEVHFMLKCKTYEDLREKMWQEFEEATSTKRETFANETEQLKALIGDKLQPTESDEKDGHVWRIYRETITAVMKYIKEAMNRRRGLQR